MKKNYPLILFMVLLFIPYFGIGQNTKPPTKDIPRQRISMDEGWKFAYGHATNVQKDFGVGTSYFSYLAKAGYGDGAASANFDDRTWRNIDVPHDWAVEVPFSNKGSHSHGYKATGPGFPETSVGWYRKTFTVSAKDKGKRFSLEFDGVARDAKVWVNGFYCGGEPSGYYSFSFDITEYLNFGGDNVIAVRADNYTEEGWYYEGGGIYRHVWLSQTNPLHIPQYGTYVTAKVVENNAKLSIQTTVKNSAIASSDFKITQKVIDSKGQVQATYESALYSLGAFNGKEYACEMEIKNPVLWSIENPELYQLETQISNNGELIDEKTSSFGVRTIEFDPDKGCFLNGKHIKLKGTNNHQDHAGVGCAIPDGLQEWRIRQLKSMGSNAIRTSHNPATPELLDICDRLGMLVLEENRLMGVTEQNLDYLKRLIVRDRNHPSIILWSIGNEEWAIEGNEKGAEIAQTMQAFAKSIDSSRYITAGVSGGWGNGISTTIDVMGYNYMTHGDIDEIHAKFPWQISIGTEEGSTRTTRGIYFDDMQKQYLAAYDSPVPGQFVSLFESWNYFAKRDYLAGLYYWTGFDYRGESTPFSYPSVASYFGIFDLCGFPKDNYYFLKSWWSNEPVLHILPHWNLQGHEGEEIEVFVYSNFDEVELFLNNKSLGKKTMELNGRLLWPVKYTPGILKAIAYKDGKEAMETSVQTTGDASKINLAANKTILTNKNDVSIITVSIADKKGLAIPNANIPLSFTINGPAKIIGVGNGDPTSHENEQFIETQELIAFGEWKQNTLGDNKAEQFIAYTFDDSKWEKAFADGPCTPGSSPEIMVYRSTFTMDSIKPLANYKWIFSSIGKNQQVYLNGTLLSEQIAEDNKKAIFELDKNILKKGKNTVSLITTPFVMAHQWDNVNTKPGVILCSLAAPQWTRTTFSGLAQLIIQSTGSSGDITLTAISEGLKPATILIKTE